MAPYIYDYLLANNRHDSIEYPSTIKDTNDLSNHFCNHFYNPDTISYARHNIRQILCDRVRSWNTSRCFTHWRNCIFRVAITEI
jgi:hypothetical protein